MAGRYYTPSSDRTPRYTVKDVAGMLEMSPYTIRYYDNVGLIPGLDRSGGNIRMFSDYALSWLKLVHCLRATGLSIEGIKRYIDLCLVGESTIPERAEIIFQQEKVLRQQIRELQKQMEVLKYKKEYYRNLLADQRPDLCNPAAGKHEEPHIAPAAAVATA